MTRPGPSVRPARTSRSTIPATAIMQTYTVSPAHASHPAAREIVASSPGDAASRAYALSVPHSQDYTYHVYSQNGGPWEISGLDFSHPDSPALAL